MSTFWVNCYYGGFSAKTISQYTGLKDKNGKEIYEGDIIECIDMHDCNIDYWIIKPPRYEVGWDNKESGFCLTNPYKGLPSKYDIEMHWMKIGNIYENPELLNKIL